MSQRSEPLPRIRVRPLTRANLSIQLTLLGLTLLTLYSFTTFDTRGIGLVEALQDMLNNFRLLLLEPRLRSVSFADLLEALFVTVGLGLLTTVFGAIIAFFLALFAAQNLAPIWLNNLIKGGTAFIRAVPTVLWVLFFAVAAGMGSVAAVIGMTFHSAGYLIKAYAESFEEIDAGVLEALRASGASWWQTVFQAVVPTSASALLSWTFVRFEINFSTAIAMGATAGAGGIGFDMFMASAFYLDLRELGAFTYAILVFAMALEWFATHMKARLGKSRE
ncbi:PhnE/PtxC family ABC transporter permease [Candidatus Viridilinea mediisalina]|uniref:Phosphonate ABC transporter permease n=1 Tax=Candidatus Viridilinea mediisalina TaxID=2024553 RepID=A0A2A6RPD2_9CHLR|nr:ABC transporter permease subunit [Candidatus Viridilinea mediisalina]PDW04954.1 phosphonate ABC transporter permease [Candidatus Viridilinea mediisalina]